jgi:hypothetical protein
VPSGAEIPGTPPDFAQDLTAAFAAVPEPTTVVFLAIATCGLAAQRTRHRRRRPS